MTVSMRTSTQAIRRTVAASTLVLGVVLGCAPAYRCDDDSQCIWQGQQGRCEATQYCSYPDEACPSQSRYSPHAGTLADQCTMPGSSDTTTDGDTMRPIPVGEDPPPEPLQGIWISPDELMARPTVGTPWEIVLAAANEDAGIADLGDPSSDHDIATLARAYVCVRLQDASVCDAARTELMAAVNSEIVGSQLELGANLLAYVIAADLLALEGTDADAVRAWLEQLRTLELEGRTMVSTHETRPNNWGTHAGASRAAIAIYLGDEAELERTAQVFRGWLGDRNAYAMFDYGSLEWQADPDNPVGINPLGATKDSHDIDGVLPDDIRRDGPFGWPPPGGSASYIALGGALPLAVILHRRGYDAFNWQDAALGRAWVWLSDVAGFEPSGSRRWEVMLVNRYYGLDEDASGQSGRGSPVAYTAWTHPSP